MCVMFALTGKLVILEIAKILQNSFTYAAKLHYPE